jgi:hypothetical protein
MNKVAGPRAALLRALFSATTSQQITMLNSAKMQ